MKEAYVLIYVFTSDISCKTASCSLVNMWLPKYVNGLAERVKAKCLCGNGLQCKISHPRALIKVA
jgi:hypothetical protein